LDWTFVGTLAEVASAFAVVVTLIFLGVEVRGYRNATEPTASDALSAGFNNLNMQITSDPEFFETFMSALSDPLTLNDMSKARVLWVIQCYINHLTTVKKYHDAGSLPEEEWGAYMQGTSQVLNSPGGIWALENVAITPSLLAEIKRHQDVTYKNGFLGLKNG